MHSYEYRPGLGEGGEEEEREGGGDGGGGGDDARRGKPEALPRVGLGDLPRDADFYVRNDGGAKHTLRKATVKR